ncbi:MAG: ATP-binding cassette domain-containing protein, partial [Pseudomonadota bacterium]
SLFKQFPRKDRERAIIELDRLGMAEKALQRAGTLSGGQQQRVAIAKAMMQSPDILLADEPIASLDPRNAHAVMQTLKSINETRNITVIVNLHALDMARTYCRRIIGMRDGGIVFDGSPEDLDEKAVALIYDGETEAEATEVSVEPSSLIDSESAAA